jgi:hypothetical protein
MKNFLHTCPPMKMEQTECSKTSAYKIQTPGNYPKESIQNTMRELCKSLGVELCHLNIEVCISVSKTLYCIRTAHFRVNESYLITTIFLTLIHLGLFMK